MTYSSWSWRLHMYILHAKAALHVYNAMLPMTWPLFLSYLKANDGTAEFCIVVLQASRICNRIWTERTPFELTAQPIIASLCAGGHEHEL